MPVLAAAPVARGLVKFPLRRSPEALFAALAREPYSFFLDSALVSPRQGRYSFMGSRPFLVMSARGRSIEIREGGKVRRERGNPFAVLRRLLARYGAGPQGMAPPFLSGAVGFVGYEAGRLLENIRVPGTSKARFSAAASEACRPSKSLTTLTQPSRRTGAVRAPDMCFAFYESVLALDPARQEGWVAATGLKGPLGCMDSAQAERAESLLAILGRLDRVVPADFRFRLASPLRSNLTRAGYLAGVRSVKAAIARGDVYQANFTQRFSASWAGDPYDLYLRLRAASPSPFAAYLNFGDVRVLSSSPERFLKISGGRAETRPIKGTRPRGTDRAGDRAAALALVKSAKDMAEHVMIVDLERNDLGKICETGSVMVPEMAALEKFPQVFHLTSTVTGRLRRGLTAADALPAMFPGGSITGAPKIRAEEILAGLEPSPRGLYTGVLGWIGFTGDCDLSMVIRTVVLSGSELSFGVGGGVVADSDPEAEYRESVLKASGIMAALGESPGASIASGVAAAGHAQRCVAPGAISSMEGK
jgi:para-aminobenzoate synthetase component 1